MHIVLGASGHLGSAVVRALLAAGEAVTAVVHDESTSPRFRERGADVVVADIADVEALRAVFAHGRRAFVLNPPADPSTDTDSVERATARAIVRALDGSGLEKVVAASTYGAQPGERIGDLSVLYEFEVQLKAGAIPAAIDRGAYYFSNWDTFTDSARTDGVVQSMLPADLQLPMVAPSDLGLIAARRMLSPIDDTDVVYIEGPGRYTPNDVASAFAAALDRDVRLDVVPPEQWRDTFRQMGFSDAAADSYTRMTVATVDDVELPSDPERGPTTLDEYIRALVGGSET